MQTASFAESPNSAVTGLAPSDWTDSVQALKINLTRTSSQTRYKTAPNPPPKDLSEGGRPDLICRFCKIRFATASRGCHSYPQHTYPSPLNPAAKLPLCSGRCCRRPAGCCCCCCWGPPAATASRWAWPVFDMKTEEI